jgi:hypothetical protein
MNSFELTPDIDQKLTEFFSKTHSRIKEIVKDKEPLFETEGTRDLDHTIRFKLGIILTAIVHRGKMQAWFEVSEIMDNGELASILRPKYEIFDSLNFANIVKNTDELKPVYEVIEHLIIMPIQQSFHAILKSFIVGVDLNSLLLELDDDNSKWLEESSDLHYQLGLHQGGMEAMATLAKGKDMSELRSRFSDNYYKAYGASRKNS